MPLHRKRLNILIEVRSFNRNKFPATWLLVYRGKELQRGYARTKQTAMREAGYWRNLFQRWWIRDGYCPGCISIWTNGAKLKSVKLLTGIDGQPVAGGFCLRCQKVLFDWNPHA